MSSAVRRNRWKIRCLPDCSGARIDLSAEVEDRLCLATSAPAFKLIDGTEEKKVTLLHKAEARHRLREARAGKGLLRGC